MKKAIYKIPNGKLLKIFLEELDCKIQNIKITGDFFMHPEENIKRLEEFLENAELTDSVLQQKISIFFKDNPTELFGIDEASLITTILQAHASLPSA